MADSHIASGIRKLNQSNYTTWATCVKSYLQGQDLWGVTNEPDTELPRIDTNGAVHKWNVKAGRAMYILKTTVEEEMLEYFQETESPKVAWDTLVNLFSKKNDTRLQLLESELMSLSQGEHSIPQFFRKVKTLCKEIGELDPQSRIGEPWMKRIIVHGLKPEYRTFVTAIQGWPTQPTLTEFEYLLAGQEALVKQVTGVLVKNDAEALYVKKGKHKQKYNRYQNRNGDKGRKVAERKQGLRKRTQGRG
ncbi:uncharacterized protein LOC143564329 [Bidens hawaiensis]|uniref:uncharacterized protein LOC143564329 n=1 Tax=Bidens hawaiensis TaxID=980011 RepID=UPI00404AE101